MLSTGFAIRSFLRVTMRADEIPRKACEVSYHLHDSSRGCLPWSCRQLEDGKFVSAAPSLATEESTKTLNPKPPTAGTSFKE